MNTAKFFNPEMAADVKKLLAEKRITTAHIEAWCESDVYAMYNELYSHICAYFAQEKVKPDTAITREHINSWLGERECQPGCENTYIAFNACKDMGLISVCGRGYTLNKPPQDDKQVSELAAELAVELMGIA